MKSNKRTHMKILYKKYFILMIRKLLGYRTFKISIGNICTRDEIITIGKEYQYKEGCRLERVKVEDVRFRNYYIEVKVNFFERNKIINCDHLFVNAGYAGMWRLLDKDMYDIDEWRREMEKPHDYSHLDDLPVIKL